MREGLHNEDGRARSAIGSVYKQLSLAEITPLLPAIHQAIIDPAPSGIMFADGVRLSGLEVLAKHHIAEGMPLCLDIMEIERWGQNSRITQCLKILQTYGGAAKPLLPKLAAIEKQMQSQSNSKNLKPHLDLLRQTMARIETDQNPPRLRSLDSLQ